MIKKGVMTAGVLILCFGIALATAATPDISIEESETRTMITGTVSDANTGDAIPQADVTLTETEAATTTDEYGIFSFQEVATGTYTLSVSAEGYEAAEVEVEVTEEGRNVEVRLTPEEE